MAAIEELNALLNQLERALHEYCPTALETFGAWTSIGGAVPSQLIALDRISSDGKRVSVALKLQADMESPLVLILPNAAHPSGLRCFAIEDSAGNFC